MAFQKMSLIKSKEIKKSQQSTPGDREWQLNKTCTGSFLALFEKQLRTDINFKSTVGY